MRRAPDEEAFDGVALFAFARTWLQNHSSDARGRGLNRVEDDVRFAAAMRTATAASWKDRLSLADTISAH